MKKKLIPLILFPLFLLPFSSFAAAKPTSVTLYTSKDCPYCEDVIDYLHKIKKRVMVKNISESSTAKKELLRIGGKALVPCLIVDGKAIYAAEPIINWLSSNRQYLKGK
jgi:glutaredoxin